jgi:hypothetical protein
MWKTASVLVNYSEHTPCKEIFQEVCDQIGIHYQNLGWKYSASRPKITFKDENFKLEIAFWSSGSNTPGDYVNLEIIPSLCSLELIKEAKARGEKSKGFILGMMEFYLEESAEVPKEIRRVRNIDGKVNDLEDTSWPDGILSFNKNINVYGITPELFTSIIAFVDNRITIWLKAMTDIELLKSLISKQPTHHKNRMKEGAFTQFLILHFPEHSSELVAFLE